MMKKVTIGILVVFVLSTASINSVFAGGGRRTVPAPEPVSCLLFLAGGATLAALQRLRNKRNAKTLNETSQDTRDVG
ncbi:MAG: hypothetical protein NG747_14615 [Candidatus Brocadia sp.]|nr:hypothetical protein [Candidatus Brocadia sp.]